MKFIPPSKPTVALSYKLALIGGHGGSDEEFLGVPWVGPGGKIMGGAMSSVGIMQSGCLVSHSFMGEYTTFKGHETDLLKWFGSSIFSGEEEPEKLIANKSISSLRDAIAEFDPNCCYLMGDLALKLAGIPHPAEAFRGTIFQCMEMTSPLFGRKCVAGLSPNSLTTNKQPELIPLFKFDLVRAKEEAMTKELVLPEPLIEIDLTCSEIVRRLNNIKSGDAVALDIEGGVTQGVTCISFATSKDHAFIVNWKDFGAEESMQLYKAVARVLMDKSIEKILQNSLYDNFVLSYVMKMPIYNVTHDTMLSGWELFPELPKALGVQSSLCTRMPYYKSDRKVDDKRVHYTYCCKDSLVTYEIRDVHRKKLTGSSAEHFKFNMQLLPALNYMELKGFRYDMTAAKEQLSLVKTKMDEIHSRMKVISGGVEVNPNTNNGANSLKNVLYKKLGFEPQYKKVQGRKTNDTTADVDALLRLVKTDKSGLIHHILQWRTLEGVRKQLEIGADPDGRVRCGYNLVGTDTGRMTCYESPSGSGMNLQTVTKKLRYLYQADPGKVLFKCDLEGADGWTVAAHCDRLGYSTMLDDYYKGIKPARVIAAMRQDRTVANLPQDELKSFIKTMDIPEWLYFACKRVQHGSNYGLGKVTMSSVILKDSWKIDGNPIYMTAADCESLQRLYLGHRYQGVVKWQEWIVNELFTSRSLSCSSGHVRKFFGALGFRDKPNPSTYQSALSHEPQANTTYAISKFLHNLWHDPENYDSRGCLIIEPLHQVHDEAVMQVDEGRAEWATSKIRQWFDNTLIIADHEIKIPFDGGYGPSWGETPNPIHT